MDVRRVVTFTAAIFVAVLSVTVVAGAQEISGGCTATVNGRAPESMTKDNPLKVDKDENVNLSGQVPPGVAPAGKQIRSTTTVYVDIFGFPVRVRTATGKGATWGGSVELPEMIRDLATGVYRVSGEATGTPGAWSCTGSAYIQLTGNALTKPATYVAAGLGAGGAALGRSAAKRKPKPKPEPKPKDRPKDDPNAWGRNVVDVIRDSAKDGTATLGADFAWLIAFLFFMFLGGLFYFMAMAVPVSNSKGRIWVRGRPIRGFFGGLLLGLGAVVVAQQFAVMVLDARALGTVGAIAVATAVRAWWGTAYKLDPQEAPAPAPPAAAT